MAEHFHQRIGVAFDGRDAIHAIHIKLLLALFERLFQPHRHRFNQYPHRNGFGVDAQLLVVNLGYVEHVVDNFVHPHRARINAIYHLAVIVVFLELAIVAQNIAVPFQNGQRGAEFVGGDFDEVGFGAVEFFEAVIRLGQCFGALGNFVFELLVKPFGAVVEAGVL